MGSSAIRLEPTVMDCPGVGNTTPVIARASRSARPLLERKAGQARPSALAGRFPLARLLDRLML